MPQFFEFHALLNYRVKHYPSVALCQYDLEHIEPLTCSPPSPCIVTWWWRAPWCATTPFMFRRRNSCR